MNGLVSRMGVGGFAAGPDLLVSIERFTPYQLIVGTMTAIYALRNLDVLLGLGGELPRYASICCALTRSSCRARTSDKTRKWNTGDVIVITDARALVLESLLPCIVHLYSIRCRVRNSHDNTTEIPS